jgi:hypothetical protein
MKATKNTSFVQNKKGPQRKINAFTLVMKEEKI